MAEEKHTEADYQKGFNEGYLITKHEPELSEVLSNAKLDNARMEGFKDGRREFVLEQSKENRPNWLKAKTEIDKGEHDKERDLDLGR